MSGRVGSREGRAEFLGGSSGPEGGRAAALVARPGCLIERLEEVVGLFDLSLEVARIELGVPDGVIDPSEVADGELWRAEVGRDCGVLKTGSGPRYGVGDDPVVVLELESLVLAT